MYTAKVLTFPNTEIQNNPSLELVYSAKLKKNGERKRTHTNHTNEERFIDPIRNKQDIENASEYLRLQIAEARTKNQKIIATRNRMLFILGINLGLRVSDLVPCGSDAGNQSEGLKWKHIFENDMETFKTRSGKKEQKTGKQRNLYLNEKCRQAVSDYIKAAQPVLSANGYVFVSNRKNADGSYKAITDECISQIIKKTLSACKVEGHFGTHTLRKTYAYQYYMTLIEQGMAAEIAIGKAQQMLNHDKQLTTLRYFGLQQDSEMEISEMLNLG